MYQANFVAGGAAIACGGPKSLQLSLYCTSFGRYAFHQSHNLATCNSGALHQLRYLDAGSLVSSFRIMCCREHAVMAMTQICMCIVMITHMYPAGL